VKPLGNRKGKNRVHPRGVPDRPAGQGDRPGHEVKKLGVLQRAREGMAIARNKGKLRGKQPKLTD